MNDQHLFPGQNPIVKTYGLEAAQVACELNPENLVEVGGEEQQDAASNDVVSTGRNAQNQMLHIPFKSAQVPPSVADHPAAASYSSISQVNPMPSATAATIQHCQTMAPSESFQAVEDHHLGQ